MNITIRTDASLQMGTGHVMRCKKAYSTRLSIVNDR